MSILQILQVFYLVFTIHNNVIKFCAECAPIQKQALSIMYVDLFEITSSADSVQQYVAIEYIQQVQVDSEKGTVIKELESLHEDANVEEVFCCDLSPESM